MQVRDESNLHQFPTPRPHEPIGGTISSPSSTEPLTPQAERILGSIPDAIGDTEHEPLPSAIDAEPDNGMVSLVPSFAFSEADVRDQIEELFDWTAEKFKSDHWKLTERQSRMLGGPTTQVLNAVWAKLSEKLPDFLTRWCDDTPGALDFLVVCGIVLAPKIATQVKLSKARRKEGKAARMVRPATSHGPAPQPRPAANAQTMIHTEGRE